jgi:sugar lactone lactonase YvrE
MIASKRKTPIIIGALLIALAALAPFALGAAAAPRPSRYILPGDTVFPEGIAYQQGTSNFYVSSNADGTIFRGDIREELTSVFLPAGSDGRTTATGLKVDDAGRLYVAGASTGKIFVYDTATGALLGQFYDGKTATFLNDIAISQNGDAYVTDSLDPTLYRVSIDAQGQPQFEAWLDFRGTPFVYQPGFNANGIVATPDGKYLVVVQSNTGKLFRINIATKEVTQIDLGGATVTNGDGLVLRGHTLYVIRNSNALIVKVQLSGDFSSGSVISSTGDPSLHFPTTAAIADGRLLVVNSQFDRRGPGLQPDLPFTVSSIRVP